MGLFGKKGLTNSGVMVIGVLCFLWVFSVYAYTSVEPFRDTIIDITGHVFVFEGASRALSSSSGSSSSSLSSTEKDPGDEIFLSVNDYLEAREEEIGESKEVLEEDFNVVVEFKEEEVIESTYGVLDSISSVISREADFLPSFSPVYLTGEEEIIYSPMRVSADEVRVVAEVKVEEGPSDFFTLVARKENGRPVIKIDFDA